MHLRAAPTSDRPGPAPNPQAPLLDLLRRRYKAGKIYTYTGDILISINPYTHVAGRYDVPGHLEPYSVGHAAHVFPVADNAYRMMMRERKDQAMIVSGESGAGKTEACKRVMQYLAALSQGVQGRRMSDESRQQRSLMAGIERRVLDCNPFLEAFGNAKTVRNRTHRTRVFRLKR